MDQKIVTPILEQFPLQTHVRVIDLANVLSSNNIIAANFINFQHIVLKIEEFVSNKQKYELKKTFKDNWVAWLSWVEFFNQQ